MPDSFLFFTAHNKIPDNSSNNNKTDESQVQIPRRSEVNLFFFGGGGFLFLLEKKWGGGELIGEFRPRGGEEET